MKVLLSYLGELFYLRFKLSALNPLKNRFYMMVDKTKLGIELFDETFGGVYRGRTVFCYGRRDSGKSEITSSFLHQAFLDGDRSLLLTDWQAKDALILAEAVGVPFNHMVRSGNLTILEYSAFVPGAYMRADSPLPPSAFVELQKIIASRSIRRVVFDTALPWLAIHPIERMPGHVYSFIHALERLNVTVLLTLPWPASTPAFMLKNRLEDVCPVVLVAQRSEDTGESFFKVPKYLGDNLTSVTPVSFKMDRGKGAVRVEDSELPHSTLSRKEEMQQARQSSLDARQSPHSLVSPRDSEWSAEPMPSSAEGEEDRPITFSSVIDL